MKKVCIVTSTRAEYGLLKPLLKKIADHPALQLQLLVTGTHLERRYGYTVREIEADGYRADAKVKIIKGDSKLEIIETAAKALNKAGKVLHDLSPDLLVVDGDRYELPPIALAAVLLDIPVAHSGGGDLTEGAYDELFRHALTKLSVLHFPTNEISRRRIIQMGEAPARVFNVGSVGVENIFSMTLLSKEEIARQMGFSMEDRTLMVAFHPVTRETAAQGEQLQALLDALAEKDHFKIIITKPNADEGREALNRMLDEFIQRNSGRCIAFESMGLLKYLSALKYCVGVVGNSSSGIIEAPSLKVGTINIGNRQKGRLKAASVIDCPPEKEAIAAALERLVDPAYRVLLKRVNNPYEQPDTSARITAEIARFLHSGRGPGKVFCDLLCRKNW